MSDQRAKNKQNEEKFEFLKSYFIGAGCSLGMSIGVVFGKVNDQVGIGIAFGTSIGLIIGVVAYEAYKKYGKDLGF